MTLKNLKSLTATLISTHTLTLSVTATTCLNLDISQNFNSHAHVERDGLFQQSIMIPQNFNSHAHVERDAAKGKGDEALYISTHTLTWSVTGAKNE